MRPKSKGGNPLFQCMVVYHTDIGETKIGREMLMPQQMIEAVDESRVGGCYLTVFKRRDFNRVTPILLNTKSDARKWASQVEKLMID